MGRWLWCVQNVLVSEGFKLKICDFGISRSVDATTEMTGNIGTIAWCAPEMLSGSTYTNTVDVYSFGILLWEIVTVSAPAVRCDCDAFEGHD